MSSVLFLFVLPSPWPSTLLLFVPLLPLCSPFSAWGSVVRAVLPLLSPLDFPFFILTLPDFDFFDLLSLLSEGFTGCCGVLLCWGGVAGIGCDWMVGVIAVVACGVVVTCGVVLTFEVALLTTTSVRSSSSVCSFAKLTNTYKNEPDMIFILLFTTNLPIPLQPWQQNTVEFKGNNTHLAIHVVGSTYWISTEGFYIRYITFIYHYHPHLVEGGLWNREVSDSQLLVVVWQ